MVIFKSFRQATFLVKCKLLRTQWIDYHWLNWSRVDRASLHYRTIQALKN